MDEYLNICGDWVLYHSPETIVTCPHCKNKRIYYGKDVPFPAIMVCEGCYIKDR